MNIHENPWWSMRICDDPWESVMIHQNLWRSMRICKYLPGISKLPKGKDTPTCPLNHPHTNSLLSGKKLPPKTLTFLYPFPPLVQWNSLSFCQPFLQPLYLSFLSMSKMMSKKANPLLSHSFSIGVKVNHFYHAFPRWIVGRKEVLFASGFLQWQKMITFFILSPGIIFSQSPCKKGLQNCVRGINNFSRAEKCSRIYSFLLACIVE